ncbi:hypothetical protein AX774_g7483 [Zancudomyces culisetae]|uniref:Uncharacterized protein n=1 Tax=Zancudomyces culisetae TaxID=1213189 RepID=A0A1R1PDW9_ZANCU|nr:hypothetical protein AX774_g7483 [Zancudomyces culisetae]|eukprot:OMH79119.1 hypothetical protein AX774_g7483 [Zancudomyces culisetae]
MFPHNPGPSSTESGLPDPTTGSPTFSPAVSSYTWIVTLSPSILITSPTTISCPTFTNSYIAEPVIFSAITTICLHFVDFIITPRFFYDYSLLPPPSLIINSPKNISWYFTWS